LLRWLEGRKKEKVTKIPISYILPN